MQRGSASFRCTNPRCKKPFNASPRLYPNDQDPSDQHREDGDLAITCPRCGADYVLDRFERFYWNGNQQLARI
jgi:hypothetical protein